MGFNLKNPFVLDNITIMKKHNSEIESVSLNLAAAAMGRKGGSSNSEAKQKASRENGKKGGRKPYKNKKT